MGSLEGEGESQKVPSEREPIIPKAQAYKKFDEVFIAGCRILDIAEIVLLFTMNIKKLKETKEKMVVESSGRESGEGHNRVKEDTKKYRIRKMTSD